MFAQQRGLTSPGVPRAKLHAPFLAASQVRRAQLCARVQAAAAARLVLVRAPAGFGKTTVMAQCRADMEAAGQRTAWLTLDSVDNDPDRFIRGLCAMVATLGGAAGQRDVPDLAQAALVLMEQLEDAPPFGLFFDDVEALQNPSVLSILRELIQNLPRQGRIMIASRSLPDLGLARMRVRGQLLELSGADLRFSVEETQTFMGHRGERAVPPADVHKLHQQTEGWAAALWLASLALERQGSDAGFIEGFSGSSDIVADYLLDEVFAAQPPALRDFLVRTSILRTLEPSLCDAVLGVGIGADMLARVAAADLFLVPIEGGSAYRYHSLFAEFLRGQLVRQQPQAIPGLHLAASCWFELQMRPVPAIEHAIEGGQFERAMALMEAHVETLLEAGRMRLLARWFDALPDAAVQERPLLSVVKVWAVCFTRGPWEAMRLLDGSGWTVDEPRVRPHVLVLRPLMLGMMDNYEAAYEVGRDSLQALPTGHPFADSVLATTMAYTFLVMGQYRESHRLLGKARQSHGARKRHFNSMYAETVEGLLELEEAQLRKATARFRFAVHASGSGQTRHTGGNAFAGVPYALTLYELDELAQAEHLLGVYLPLARDVGLRDHIIMGHVALARIALQQGQTDQAWDLLTHLEEEGHARQLPRIAASARLERSHLYVLQGDADSARSELERAAANEDAVWQQVARLRLPAHDLEDLELGRLRWEACFGEPGQLVRRIEQAIAQAQAHKRKRRALKLRLLLAIALRRKGATPEALSTLGQLVRVLGNEGFVRLVVDEGLPAGQLLQLLVEHPQYLRGVEGNPILEDYVQRLLRAFGPLPPTLQVETQERLETLTPKELRMLQLLADGSSNVELAQRLCVSDSTVRTHLRNINMKLNAQSRTQAVAIGRRFGLIT
jgi:LuxR family maltose regulon positive regulatory protein